MSKLLVSRPHFDTRAVTQHEQLRPPVDPETTLKHNFLTSSGLAAAGYRSAKYTPAEWMAKNNATLNQALSDLTNSEKIRFDSKVLYTETEVKTLRTQADGTTHLGERLQDIHFWKSELERHIEHLGAETDLLLAEKCRLEKGLDATEIPFAIATDNLTCRERRLGPDLVKDLVEEELIQEVELIRSIQALHKRTLDQTVAQIKSNRDAKQTLEMDWSDKHQAYSLDNQCGRYSNTSSETQHQAGSAKIQDHVSNSEEWMYFTQANLAAAEHEMRASAVLRKLIERVLQDTSEDLRAQCSRVDLAFNQRCQELTEAKIQLELHLSQILQQIGTQERNIVSLQQALHDKEAPMRVAQSRLYQRTHRPNMELCRDSPQLSLVDEVETITHTMSALTQQLCVSRDSLAALEETRMALEKAIACKTHSLLIDREKCMGHRTRYPDLVTLSGY
ncbi:tektin-4 [Clupea harengus]|uniref:Tektin n=1 Tax=Clupea harengus TaxID=7950 RepID=A0A6P3VQT9_CLUHA|nr:tektin-4 [Clupea harengus]